MHDAYSCSNESVPSVLDRDARAGEGREKEGETDADVLRGVGQSPEVGCSSSWSSISRSPVDLPHGFFFFQSIDSSRFPSKRRKWRLLFEGTPRFV
jgi:hypothetical protein